MSGEISKTFNRLLTATMLVILLIACEKTPDDPTVDNQPGSSTNLINNYK
ncbi:conserved hypothetical protein [Hyella patelloides LEGE 07179]|uniref:Uncharacterized protein n=1 Tax=Hyella patelloides LEGE 07179 TaxID=945734 RepID=A0A563VQ74_9CYAN|nr:hypothetical protein [Hyella patelloides]VEP13561.1 conserved hypothetical protein [Hyella patelloides LEGE 07179]